MMMKVVWLAVGGACGTLARVGLASLVQRIGVDRFPWGTVSVNLLGCFLFGFVWSLTEERIQPGSAVRWVVLTGFMGAFTTFSTFMFDAGQLASASRWAAMIGNVVLQNALGLVLLFVGLAAGRAL